MQNQKGMIKPEATSLVNVEKNVLLYYITHGRERTFPGFKLSTMKKVLIGLDYDSSAEKVAEAGYAFAKAMDAEVILVHVVADSQYYASTEFSPIMGFSGFNDFDFLQPDLLNGLKKSSEKFLEASKKHLNDERIETMVLQGDVTESILAAADDRKADLIVMGSHSRKWLENIVLGSATSKVLHHTTIPLLVIPTRQKNRE